MYSERIINSWWIFQGFDLTQKEGSHSPRDDENMGGFYTWQFHIGWLKKWKTWEHIFLLVEVQRICFFFVKLWRMGDGGQIWRSDSLSVFFGGMTTAGCKLNCTMHVTYINNHVITIYDVVSSKIWSAEILAPSLNTKAISASGHQALPSPKWAPSSKSLMAPLRLPRFCSQRPR